MKSITAFIFLSFIVAQVGTVDHISEWGAWTDWTHCSVTCGYGTITKTGFWFDKNGAKTNETYTQQVGCYQDVKCPVDGNWTMWSPYSACSKPCGVGLRERSRSCTNPRPRNGGNDCFGPDKEQISCELEICPTIPPNFDLTVCSNPSMLWCTSKQMCVEKTQRCDRTVQCHDGSDEYLCYKYTNASPAFHGSAISVIIFIVLSSLGCVSIFDL